MITTLRYYKGIAIATTSSGFLGYNQYILSVSKSEIGGTYNPIIFVFVYYVIDVDIESILRSKPENSA